MTEPDLTDLIEEHQSLLKEYQDLIARFPGSLPNSLPAVRVTPEGPKPLPPRLRKAHENREAERTAWFAIHTPLHGACWIEDQGELSTFPPDFVPSTRPPLVGGGASSRR